jgi:hypothetical protein
LQIEKWKYTNVNLDGAVPAGGRIGIDFIIKSSLEDGCTLEDCRCKKCYWISVNLGIQSNGSVYGLSYYFRTKQELSDFVVYN